MKRRGWDCGCEALVVDAPAMAGWDTTDCVEHGRARQLPRIPAGLHLPGLAKLSAAHVDVELMEAKLRALGQSRQDIKWLSGRCGGDVWTKQHALKQIVERVVAGLDPIKELREAAGDT